ncbi:uncharacterized protein si:rp71-17i16.6 isoform X2 [Onychostoma macrolepis]|uniref:uncharacterized protein si:rp71-17i16.6 isoform X2 n=1 Tax=Onychostoma macrolepis TaxID=369639 RepID=UPI00272BD5FF|nr:uncharacterized protein si:rp71-17i16.6 isoform X2 [Onychostoma macrolepis]
MTKHNMMLENKLIEDDCHLKCKQYLISLFGESTAEYFLSPSSCSKEIPSWFSQLKDDMKDHTSAISLWDAMRQRSTQILQESNKEPSMIVRRVTDWKTLKKQDHLMHLSGVKYMFRCAKRNQAISALLLKHNPLFNYGINNGLN